MKRLVPHQPKCAPQRRPGGTAIPPGRAGSHNKRDGDFGAGAYSASPLVSPVRMRTAWEISSTKILPSPILPVLADF